MRKLYTDQLRYWNGELAQLSKDNADSLGRGFDGYHYAIFWNNKSYAPEKLDWTPSIEKAYCLPLNPRLPKLASRMQRIAEEYEELCDERYEAERFLSNLMLFSAPPKRLRKILGRTLYKVCEKNVERYCSGFSDRDWALNNEFSLKTFVENNQSIIKAMNARVIINLVTL